ncbi:Gametocyte-specific factor 1 [Larimichthys crocea]|uniref:Uncharacterized protein n=1 Tax=Larimichthys crocea TaxID=215358 RepID=A0ACD3RBB0_LARCR|nr:Gametocyte-specific factor 1 [Larimichthys crocea]
MVRARRLQLREQSCQRKLNHPKLASELKTCPFNARHLVPKSELTHHTATCEDRISLDADDGGSTNGHWKSQIPVSTWVNTNTTEDWDEGITNNHHFMPSQLPLAYLVCGIDRLVIQCLWS